MGSSDDSESEYDDESIAHLETNDLKKRSSSCARKATTKKSEKNNTTKSPNESTDTDLCSSNLKQKSSATTGTHKTAKQRDKRTKQRSKSNRRMTMDMEDIDAEEEKTEELQQEKEEKQPDVLAKPDVLAVAISQPPKPPSKPSLKFPNWIKKRS